MTHSPHLRHSRKILPHTIPHISYSSLRLLMTVLLRADGEAGGAPQPQPQPHLVINKQLVDYIVRSGIAGGVAGLAAKTLIAPLDRVKILFQTLNPAFVKYAGLMKGMFAATGRIYSSEGVRGLFQGHSATLLRIFPYAAIKFVAYEQIRGVLIPRDEFETAGRRLAAGLLLGLALVFCTYPLDLLRVRLAFLTEHHTRNMLSHTVRSILAENPATSASDPWVVRLSRRVLPGPMLQVANFYRGFVPTVLGMVPYAGVSFYVHDLIHDIMRSPALRHHTVRYPAGRVGGGGKSSHDQRPPLKAWAQLVAGGLAGMLSQTAAYPFEVIRRRMQVGGCVNQGEFASIGGTARRIWGERGVRGFFVGLSIGYVKVVPMVACSFYVYERMKTELGI